jgi:UDP-N-acetylmuramoyl-L-alanyl-D-glutamate--2,6-diaminopimelate ligase
MGSYSQAKARFFEDFDLKISIFNADDPFCKGLMQRLATSNRITYGTSSSADLRVKKIDVTSGGSLIDLLVHGVWHQFQLKLLGDFNVENALAAVAAMTAIEPEKVEQIFSAMSNLQTTPGRMEYFQSPGFATAVVDYAHTPDAMERALITCRRHCQGQLWSVFGCGGDRDSGKRPLMGRIASELSDFVVLTSDNPRSESPQAILSEIRAGMTKPPVLEEIDRATAIRFAVDKASPNDYVFIAGKGHDSFQVIGQTSLSFSDRVEVARLFGLIDQEAQHAS